MSIARGKDLPAELQQPEIIQGLEIFLEAFWECHRERNWSGYGPTPIKRSVIRAWMNDSEIDEVELREAVIFHVENLDAVYCRFFFEKQKEEAAQHKTANGVGDGLTSRIIQPPSSRLRR